MVLPAELEIFQQNLVAKALVSVLDFRCTFREAFDSVEPLPKCNITSHVILMHPRSSRNTMTFASALFCAQLTFVFRQSYSDFNLYHWFLDLRIQVTLPSFLKFSLFRNIKKNKSWKYMQIRENLIVVNFLEFGRKIYENYFSQVHF